MMKHYYWAATLSGLLTVASSAPFDLWFLAYFSFVPLLLTTRDVALGVRGGAFALCCLFIAANWWHSTIIYSWLFFFLIVSILCFSFFLWGAASGWVRRKFDSPYADIFLPAIIWVGIERILSSEVVGIPCNIGISQWEASYFIQSASFTGIYTTSFLLVLSNTVIAASVHALRVGAIGELRTPAWLLGLVLLVANILYSGAVMDAQDTTEDGLSVSIIQPVIGSDMYINSWRSPETRDEVKAIIRDLTLEAAATSPDMLVWPEGGNGFYNLRIDELRDFLYGLASEHGMDLIISSNDLDSEGRKYNSVFSISEEGELLGRYDKVMLIPGPEDSYTAGDGFITIPSTYGAVGPSVCYESNFPSPLRKSTSNGAELLVVSTSDAAFKKTALTINHTRTAVFRAIENGRYVIHASNTGPSAIVSPVGEILVMSDMYARQILNGHVGMRSGETVFVSYGHMINVLFSGVTILLLALMLREVAGNYQGVTGLVEAIRRLAIFPSLAPLYLLKAVALLSSVTVIVAVSILIVFRSVETAAPMPQAFTEFFTPVDTFVKDTVSEGFLQAESNTCGPAVLAYVSTFFGKVIQEDRVVEMVNLKEEGTSMLDMRNAAITLGFDSMGVKANYSALKDEPLPVIAYINDSHYVVINEISGGHLYVFDPAIGHVKLPEAQFRKAWEGYLLLVRMKDIQLSSQQ